jgi:GTP-binding protein
VEADDKIFVTPPRRLTLEDAIGYVGPDELLEITPAKVRLRKQMRSGSQRRAKARNGGDN